jgi:hypothetical protein
MAIMTAIRSWWRARAAARKARDTERLRYRMAQIDSLMEQYPEIDRYTATAFYCPEPMISGWATKVVQRAAQKRERRDELRQIIREELNRGEAKP